MKVVACSLPFLALLLLGWPARLPAQSPAEPTIPKVRTDTAAYRSAVALAAGRADAEPAPGDAAARALFWDERGVWLLRLEQWKLAEQDFFAVLQKAPTDVTARSGAAWVALKTGRIEAARNRLDELQQELPDVFAVASEAADIRPAALARVADHVFWRRQRGSLAAGDLAEAPYDFGQFQLDALLEDAASALESGLIDSAEESVASIVALGAPDLPALPRFRAQIVAARAEMQRLEPDAPDLAPIRYLLEQGVAQAQARAGKQAEHPAWSASFLQSRTVAFNCAAQEPDRPTIHARRRLLARWLALRAGAEKPTELEFVRDDLVLAARLFASTPNEGDAASASLAVENLARLRQIAPHWPLSAVKALPSAWPAGELSGLVADIADGAPLQTGDARLQKAAALWPEALKRFAAEHALDTPADAVRLGDHYRIGAALAAFEDLTVPRAADDEAMSAELEARIELLVRMSEVCAVYPTLAAAAAPASPLHEYFGGWPPAHRGTPKAEELGPLFARLGDRAWRIRGLLPCASSLPGPLPWKVIREGFEADYASYVAPTQIHDLPFLSIIARLRAHVGDIEGTLDVLPLLQCRNQLDDRMGNLQLPTPPSGPFAEELREFVQSLRAASPAAATYAELDAWLEARRHAPEGVAPLPAVPAALRSHPVVAQQLAWASIVAGEPADPWATLREAEAAAKNSASYGLVAPELMLHALARAVVPLYERGRRVWECERMHLEEFDEVALQQQRAACTALMRRLLDLKDAGHLKTLEGGDLLEFRLAYAAGDFARAAKTQAGAGSERFILRGAQSEAAAQEGLQLYRVGNLAGANARLRESMMFLRERDREKQKQLDILYEQRGEYTLLLWTLVDYAVMDRSNVTPRIVLDTLQKVIAITRLPGHLAAYRDLAEEVRWRAAYVDDPAAGRRAVSVYLTKLLFLHAARNPVFERAHFLDPDTVGNLISSSSAVDIRWLEIPLYQGMPPAPEWDGHRVEVERVVNPSYATNKGKYFDAIVAGRHEDALALADTPPTVTRRREYNEAEPSFWRYYREIRGALKW